MDDSVTQRTPWQRARRQCRRAWGVSRSAVRRHRPWFIAGVICIAGYGASGQFSFMYATSGESHFFEADGITLHYTLAGEGEPVVLLHGFAMNQDISWQYAGIPAQLAERYQVIALDQRGHGISDKPYEDEAYGHEMVRDVVRLLDHLDIPRAHVIGSSMGAIVALRLAIDYPDRVISVLPCAMGWPRPVGDNMEALTALAASLSEGAGFDPLLRRLYHGHDPSYWTRMAVNTVVGYLNDTQALAAVARALPALAVAEEELRNLEVPVLSVIGTLDPLIEDVYAMEGLIPRHEIVELEGCDHFRMASYPGYLETLLDFLDRHAEQDLEWHVPNLELMDEAA